MEAQKLVLPVSLCITITLSALYLGRQIGDAERRFKDLETKVAGVDRSLKELGATAAALTIIRGDVENLKESRTADQEKFRQLWYYTHGRIQRLPWHPPQQEE